MDFTEVVSNIKCFPFVDFIEELGNARILFDRTDSLLTIRLKLINNKINFRRAVSLTMYVEMTVSQLYRPFLCTFLKFNYCFN